MPRTSFLDLASARSAPGLRLVLTGVIPSPWSEAAKGLFHARHIAYGVIRHRSDDAELAGWTGTHNAPVVFHGDEAPRSGWKEIVELADELPGEVSLAPADLELLNEIAGEDGLGWSSRLVMVHAGLESGGTRGFPVPIARYLGAKYGYAPERMPRARARIAEVLQLLDATLAPSMGREYLGGDRPSAVDVYAATFLTPIVGVSEHECPAMRPSLRPAFLALGEEVGANVTEPLRSHRARMFERHLEWPIVL